MPVIGATDGSGGGWVTASGNNNGGTLIGAGDIDTDIGPVKNDLAITTIADKFDDVTGSKVVANDGTGAVTTDRAGVDKAVSGGTLAFTPDKDGTRSEIFIMRGVTTKIGGQTSSDVRALNAGSSYAASAGITRASIPSNYAEGVAAGSSGVRLGVIVSNSGAFHNTNHTFNVLARPSTDITPAFVKDSDGVASAFTQFNTDGTVAVKSEIFPSRSVPGELTYHFGAAGGPTTDEYKAKDTFEDATDASS